MSVEAPMTIVQMQVVLSAAQCLDCEWIPMLFEAKGLSNRRVVLEAFLERGDAPRPEVVGYPVAETVRP